VKGESGFYITLFAVKMVNQGENAKICYHVKGEILFYITL